MKQPIPIVDLFAGPGGLGEGFSSVNNELGERAFEIKVSIEMDPHAHATLELRALYRSLLQIGTPDAYYDYIKGNISETEFLRNPRANEAHGEAVAEAHCLELGNDPKKKIDMLIGNAVSQVDDWVLIGGPPCQAYSMAGRSRRISDPSFQDDPKHFLYREYLRIIRKFKPAVFVMENVKGMLSSTHKGQLIFERIISDLSAPALGIYYDIRSFTVSAQGELQPKDYVIEAERYGVPQTRHRVILLGVRTDRAGQAHKILNPLQDTVSVNQALAGMPEVRSRLSKELDSVDAWLGALNEAKGSLKGWKSPLRLGIEQEMAAACSRAANIQSGGSEFIATTSDQLDQMPVPLSSWLQDKRLGGVLHHETRSHMRSDLHRYLFAACFSKRMGYSTKLGFYPQRLLPNHRNVSDETVPFQDRFRVQVGSLPSTTVVSHIAKDGHYYIHPDPAQCRSFTVREAARLQTFPDNYFFSGNRTQKYHQVGNAVPPYLAYQLGKSVFELMTQTEKVGRREVKKMQPRLFADEAF
ncbi:DNA cytosine methyltransferase [Alcaligenaceae bacterium B3P038]|nr:DNA cytosine methyltransferase [Alcaligenaceae bacterium B3P038]